MSLLVELRRWAYRLAYLLLHIYWFVLRPSTHGVKCVLSAGEQVLLVRHTYGPPEWELPGGGLKRGEDPLAGVQREMHEELGIEDANWIELGTISGQLHHHQNTLYCFQADLSDASLRTDPGEIAVTSWFRRDQLPADLGRYVKPVLALAGPAQVRPEDP